MSDKMKCGAARHLERCPRVMREHKDRRVIGRLVTPPAFPLIRPFWPSPAHRTKHIPPENISANPFKALCGDIVVDAGLAILIAVHPLPGARGKEPVKYFESANSERILKVLIRPGAEAID